MINKGYSEGEVGGNARFHQFFQLKKVAMDAYPKAQCCLLFDGNLPDDPIFVMY